jgi:hypothetical protein
MKYSGWLDALDHAIHVSGVARVAMHKFHAAGTEQPLEIVRRAVTAQVVEQHYAPAILAQPGGDVAADKPATSSYERGVTH